MGLKNESFFSLEKGYKVYPYTLILSGLAVDSLLESSDSSTESGDILAPTELWVCNRLLLSNMFDICISIQSTDKHQPTDCQMSH